MQKTKIVFLTCQDLSDYSVDDQTFFNLLKEHSFIDFNILPWDQKGIEWNDFDIAIIRTTWDYAQRLEDFVQVLAKIEQSSCCLINSKDIVTWNINKKYLFDLEEQGVRILPSKVINEKNLSSTIAWIDDQETYVLKPLVGASASGIEVLTGTRALQRIKEVDFNQYFIQKFHPEIEKGEYSFFFYDDQFSHAVIKTPKAGDFRVQEEHGGLISPYKPSQKDLAWSEGVLRAAADLNKAPLYARVDALWLQNEWHLMELELIEPAMYFSICPESAQNMLDFVLNWIKRI